MFHVGQVVVCVDDNGTCDPVATLRKGAVYTVRWAGEFNHPVTRNHLCIRVHEIAPNTRCCGYYGIEDMPFSAHRFRPAVSTDISIFQAMLSPAPKVDA